MFRDRLDAAEQLADAVAVLKPRDPVVLALPRGGVPLGVVVAQRLGAPLDLLMVRKIGSPGNPEVAAGAMVDGAAPIIEFNPEILRHLGLAEADFAGEISDLRKEIDRRRAAYMPNRAPEPLAGRTAIIVDDGIATGATVRVAIKALRAQNVEAVWVAVPVAPPDVVDILSGLADRVICLTQPSPFLAVGAHYRNFGQVPDEEVIDQLKSTWASGPD